MVWWQAEVRAQDRSADLRYEFFCCERMRAEALGHIASDTVRSAGCMDRFVVQRRGVVIR